MNAKFTPGPWTTDGHLVGHGGPSAYTVIAEVTDGQAYEKQNTDPETQKANARLIESAPDLFSIAEDLEYLLDILEAGNPPEIIADRIRKYGARARACLAKIRNPAPATHHPDSNPGMTIPNITPEWKYYDYWKPVQNGASEPDDWQRALMDLTRAALDEGLSYNSDVEKYIRAHADFIPSEWWSYQYKPGHEVEGGIMGMELYSARNALLLSQERAENAEALKLYTVGQKIGTLYIQGKRVTGLVIEKFEGTKVWMTTTIHGNTVKVWVAARAIAGCKQRAIERGWCKA